MSLSASLLSVSFPLAPSLERTLNRAAPLSRRSARHPSSPAQMGSISSGSSSALRSRARAPLLPLIPCPDCGKTVKRSVSGTPEHTGWTFYKCRTHGYGAFWHWELEYAVYPVEHNFIQGDLAVDALGWAEDRREQLVLRQAEKEATGDAGAGARQMKLMINTVALLNAIKEVLLLLKIGVMLLCVLSALVIFKK